MFQALRTTTFLGLLAAAFPALVCGQATVPSSLPPSQQTTQPTEGAQPAAKAGEQTGSSAHSALVDAQHRPITEGGFVKSGPIVFQDVSEKAGLTHWTYKMGTPAKDYII